jgi:hypothetical protein
MTVSLILNAMDPTHLNSINCVELTTRTFAPYLLTQRPAVPQLPQPSSQSLPSFKILTATLSYLCASPLSSNKIYPIALGHSFLPELIPNNFVLNTHSLSRHGNIGLIIDLSLGLTSQRSMIAVGDVIPNSRILVTMK